MTSEPVAADVVAAAAARPQRRVAFLCRTSDRSPWGSAGTAALAERLGARTIGSPSPAKVGRWDEDLAACRGCLLEAGGQVDDAFEAGERPLVLAADCTIGLGTLPVVARHRPDAWVAWFDAHPDFHTPETSTSGFLGGMPLAAACGLWDSGLGSGLDPARVAMFGVRDVDGPERVALATHGVGHPHGPDALAGRPVFIHLDLDVLDPAVLPASFPSPDGWMLGRLHETLRVLAASSELIGAEVTSSHPDLADALVDVLAPLL